jgi:hypothetical protein
VPLLANARRPLTIIPIPTTSNTVRLPIALTTIHGVEAQALYELIKRRAS